MLWIFIIFLMTIPLLNYICFKKTKILSVILVTIPFIVMQLITPLLISSTDLMHSVVSPLYITFMSITMASIYGFFGYKMYGLFKTDELKSNMMLAIKKYLPILISLAVFWIIMIFVNSYFPDTEAYLTASQRYADGLNFSFNGVDNIESFYLYPGMIGTYSSLFYNDLPYAYYFLNPFILTFTLMLSFYEFYWSHVKEEYSNKNLIISFISILALAVSTPLLSSFMTGGNIFNQSAILAMSLFVVLNKGQGIYMVPAILLFGFFFSISSAFIGSILLVALLIYALLFKGMKDFVKIWSYGVFILMLSLFSFINKTWLLYLGYAFLMINIGACYALIKLPRFEKFLNWKLFSNEKYDKHICMFQIIAFIINAILIVILFGFVYKFKSYYTSQLVFVNMGLYFAISLFLFLNYRKAKYLGKELIFLLMSSCISTVVITLAIIVKFDNASIWRIIYCNLGMGGPLDIIYSVFALLLFFLPNINFKFKKNKDENLNQQETNAATSHQWLIYIKSALIVLVAAGFTVYNFASLGLRLFRFTDNVQLNARKVSVEEANFLRGLDKNKDGDKSDMLMDLQVFYLISDITNRNNQLYNESFFPKAQDQSNWTISSYNFEGSVKDVDTNPIPENFAALLGERMLNLFFPVENTTNWTLDYVILDNFSPYHNKLTSFLSESGKSLKIVNLQNISVIERI
ncbi:MAG: hypothetical protein ACRC4L_00070 [Mycoplasma sp.]